MVPAFIRKQFQMEANCKLEWIPEGHAIRVIPLGADTIKMSRGIAKGTRLMQLLMEDRRKERARGQK